MYELQRSINYEPFHTIFSTTNFNSITYTDAAVYWYPGSNETVVQYRIGAFYNLPFTIDVSNYVKIGTVGMEFWKPGQNNRNLNEISLQQNYPNPFNPATEITFTLPSGDNVRIVVYDLLGKEITTLAEGYLPAGSHTVKFNAFDLSSGIYFYSLQTKDYFKVKKLTVMK